MKTLRFSRIAALGALSIGMASQPASAGQISLVGHVQTICEMQFQMQDALNADLVIFCNSPEGAVVTATIVDGDPHGYTFSSRSGSVVATLGNPVDIQSYSNAFAGHEHIQIAQASRGAQVAPSVMFEIRPE